MNEHMAVGERITYWRRRRGLTQEVLAGLVGRSVPWLSRIERGERTVEAIKDLLALGNALKISPGDLLGGISLPPNGGGPLDPPRGIPAIRRVVFTDRPADRAPIDGAALRVDVQQAKQLSGNGAYEALALILPDLLIASRAAVAQEAPGAWWSLACAYQAASGLAHTLGELDLACATADRALAAAQRSGDPLMVAVSERHIAGAWMRQGWLDEAGGVCSDAADALAPTDDTSPEGWSVWGSLHFVAATTAVRSGDAAGAWRLLRDAQAAGERVGPGRNDYYEAFGPASVGANKVMVALESGDAVEALRIADTVEVDEMPTPWRRARFLIDVAHAHVLRRDDGTAVAVLLEAERHGPEVVRYSLLARDLVRVCLGRERRSRTPGLRGLAERTGVAN